MPEAVGVVNELSLHHITEHRSDIINGESENLAFDGDASVMTANSGVETHGMETSIADHPNASLTNTEYLGVNQPIWENDNDVKECRSCMSRFSIFKRKHHCRKCGRIFCAQCCWKYCTYIPGSIVVQSENYGGNRIIRDSYKYYEFRTCNTCFEEISMLKTALGMSTEDENQEITDEEAEEEEVESSRSNDSNAGSIVDEESRSITPGVKQSEPQDITFESDTATIDDLSECPICGVDLTSRIEIDRENHISTCVRDQGFGSPHDGNFVGRRHQNRMLVYTLKKGQQCMDECVICLDDFHEGDKVARLECLCYFHNQCLKDWIKKKGYCECPVHSLTTE